MRLVTYQQQGNLIPGVIHRKRVIAIADLVGACTDVISFIAQGPAVMELLHSALHNLDAGTCTVASIPEEDARLVAPIPRPRKNVFCVGRNYAEHAQERGADRPDYPVFFTKASNTVVGPGAHIQHPTITKQLDYEGELAVVIGKGGCDINRADALAHVFGYTIINDITARDLQKRHQQWFKGKSLDSSCPMGPVIVTADEVPDPQNLDVRTWVNGELRQSANTSSMIFTVPVIIEWLSQGYTLEPGDIIATGTPAGVGAGYEPPRFLQGGDVIDIEISGIGRLRNTVDV